MKDTTPNQDLSNVVYMFKNQCMSRKIQKGLLLVKMLSLEANKHPSINFSSIILVLPRTTWIVDSKFYQEQKTFTISKFQHNCFLELASRKFVNKKISTT